MRKERDVRLDELVCDERYYPRLQVNWMTLARYVEAMRSGALFPPITLGAHGGKLYLWDGWHRVRAARSVGRVMFPAIVHTGVPQKLWLKKALELNAAHGMPLSMQDRLSVALRLRERGESLQNVASALGMMADELKERLKRRTIVNADGTKRIAKAATEHLVGTKRENDVARHDGPIARARVHGTFDELLGLLRMGAVILETDEALTTKAHEVHERLAVLLGPMVSG